MNRVLSLQSMLYRIILPPVSTEVPLYVGDRLVRYNDTFLIHVTHCKADLLIYKIVTGWCRVLIHYI